MSSISLDSNDDIWNLFNHFDDIKLSEKKMNNSTSINDRTCIDKTCIDRTCIDKTCIDRTCINNDCKSSNINIYENTYICDDCNTLQEKYIDNQAEWRYYGNDDTKKNDPTRCGMPMNDLLPELSLGSIISNDYNTSYYMYKIRKYQKLNSTSYKERSLYQIIDKIRGDNYPVTDRSIDFQIVGLRKKMGKSGALIQTIRGVGYRFKSRDS